MSIGKGRFHIIFKDVSGFLTALAFSYFGKSNKRCWALVSSKDNLVVIQPSVSTPGLNVLILETGTLEKGKVKEIKKLLTKEGVAIIVADWLRRPSQAQGFSVGFKKVSNFITALKTFYTEKKQDRCRVIVPRRGALIVQPSVSTPELNTLVLEGFSSIIGEEKEKLEKAISSLEEIKCDSVLSPFKTTNF